MIEPSPTSILDPQVNGYAGVDFQADNLSAERLRIATQGWRRDGGDQFLLTLVTDHWPVLLNRLRQLRNVVVGRPDLREVIPGWHIEGPFLSDQPGFHGAHEPALMLDPTRDHLQQLRDAVGSDPILLTLAPERRGSIEAIAEARRLGITVSLGHTNASATQIREAVSAGATGFTHLGNACPQQLDRHDNILWRVADVPNLTIGLIADGLHVSPLLFRLLHRAVSPDRIYYTTDAMSAAGAPPGDYPLGRLRLHVGPDRIVRQPGRSNFAGSALMPNELLPRASEMLGVPAEQLAGSVSETPRRWLGLPLLDRQAP
jgi:N-acetylglucosamine-6-phosphate deacetylase